eukprot:TRINITY_DN88368_c0_g1_i1.p1 TRINITY_DN88368_c0_g1~~TRINITY_DN88368_c0_g1_i1.p1  ORF type:complete len:1082 (+),score=174.15 TRINITY_DN88368_c0_g1_i1:33-3278(+)
MSEAIKVALRVRPVNDRELSLAAGESEAVLVNGSEVTILSKPPKAFEFDFAYSGSPQEPVYRDIGQTLVASAFSGYNSSLFAYGQTGSGKSYTVMGMGDASGLLPRCMDEVFSRKKDAGDSKEILVWASFVELYNEHIKDLLIAQSADADKEPLKIIDHPVFGACIPNLTEAACNTSRDMEKLLDRGLQKRITGATQMNSASSRSHVVFTIKVHLLEGKRPRAGEADMRKVTTAKINVADLAGSERQAKTGAEGTRLREGCSINQSLSALAHIIHELSENVSKEQSHKTKVAFRASKLTFLLKDSLAGNSRSFMVACVSPSVSNLPETFSTLRFATSVKKIKTKAVRNVVATRSEVEQSLRDEIKELKRQLDEARLSAAGHDEMQHLEGMLAYTTDLESMGRKSLAQRFDTASSLGEQTPAVLDEQTPFLMNMSDDPLMAGCLMYYVPEGASITAGSAQGNTLCVQGVGISERLCQVTSTGKNQVFIEKISEEGRVNVSGKLLTVGCPKALKHNDTIYLGRSMALKFVVPQEATDMPLQNTREQRRRLSSLCGIDDEWLAMEDCPNWISLQEYFTKIAVHLPVTQARQLRDDMKRAWTLCEEANDITRECRASEGLAFEMDLTSTIPSSVVIRVLQAVPGDDGSFEDRAPLYLWSLPQMSERLERMRDFYEEILLRGSLEVDPLLDPWHEPQQGAIELRLAELEVLYKTQQEIVNSVKTKTRKSMQLWSGGDVGSFLRNCFHAWKECVSSRSRGPRWKATFKAKQPPGRSMSHPTNALASPRQAPGMGKRRSTSNALTSASESLSDNRSNMSPSAPSDKLSTTSKDQQPPNINSEKLKAKVPPEGPGQKYTGCQVSPREEDAADDTEEVLPRFISQGVGTEDILLMADSAKQATGTSPVADASESREAGATDGEVLRKELEEVWWLCDQLTKQMQDYRRDAAYPLQIVSSQSPVVTLPLSPASGSPISPGSHTPLCARPMPARHRGATYVAPQAQRPPLVQVRSPRLNSAPSNAVPRVHASGTAAVSLVGGMGAGYASPSAGYASPSAGSASPSVGYVSPSAGYASPSAGYASPSQRLHQA